MYARSRGDGKGAAPRRLRSRILIALVGAAALTLGPGALAAQAAEPEAEPVVVTAATQDAPLELAAAESVPPAPPDPAAAPEPVAPEPVAPEPVAVPEPVAPEPVVPEPVATESAVSEPAAPDQGASDGDTSEAAADPSGAALTSEKTAPTEARMLAAPSEKTPGNNGGSNNANVNGKIVICHAKGEGVGNRDKPYVQINVNKDGSVNGHAGHTGEIPLGDIIPPFDYQENGQMHHFDGLNWSSEGQSIYQSGCMTTPPNPDEVSIVLGAVACTVPGSTAPVSLAVTVSGITGSDTGYLLALSADGDAWTQNRTVSVDGTYDLALKPGWIGNYDVSISLGDVVKDADSTTIEACAPDPVTPGLVSPDLECFVAGELPESVLVGVTDFSDLGEGTVQIRVDGADGFSATVDVPTPGDYAVPVNGVGDYTLTLFKGETVYASGGFTVVECDAPEPVDPVVPPVPVDPVVPPQPSPVAPLQPSPAAVPVVKAAPAVHQGLAVTGTQGLDSSLAAIGFFALAGGALLLSARRLRTQ